MNVHMGEETRSMYDRTIYSYPKGDDVNMQCIFHAYSKPEGVLVQKVQNGLLEVKHNNIYTKASRYRCS